MAYGNAIGSIICNTALIAALTIAIRPAKVDRSSLIIPVCFFFGSAIFFSIMAYFFGDFPRWAGILLVLTFIAYMILVILKTVKKPKEQTILSAENYDSEEKVCEQENEKTTKFSLLKEIGFLLVGAGLIAFGATLLVEKGQIIARALGVPETVISLTFISIGTSLPELVTAITSLVKGKGALSLGNLIGANLFNLVLVGGIAISIAPFSLPIGVTIGNISASLIIDIPVMLTVMEYLRGAFSYLDEINARLGKASLKATFFSSLTNPATRFVNSTVYAFVALFGALLCISSALRIASFCIFIISL